jgi:bifunctional non-homologous end joining protein LigD
MPKRPLPQFVDPMQPSSVKKPFNSPDWIFETKLDGYRAIAVIDSTGKARIWSRNHLPLEQKFPTIQSAVSHLNLRSTILDSEIVALDNEGILRFQLLQQWQKRPAAPVCFYLFDLLWSDVRDLTAGPSCNDAKDWKKSSLPFPVSRLVVTSKSTEPICSNWQRRRAWKALSRSERRADISPVGVPPDWLKIKSRPQQEFVVCGFTEGKGSRKHLGSLLLGAYRNGKLRYFGHSGTGFTEKGLAEAIQRLRPFFTDNPSVENPPKIPEKIQWVEPRLVCEVAFAEWTEDEQLRQTTFLGWRDDKSAEEVVI